MWLRSWAGRMRLVSSTSARSRNSDSSSRSCSMASVSARYWSSVCLSESGCRRLVSEKRLTRVSVVASRNTVRRCTSCPAWFLICSSRSGSPGNEAALRTSMAMATLLARWLCSSAMNEASSSGGRLSTQ
ncbi:hypothetical protein FQZ97_1022970 [compost metagenome]